VFSGVVVVVDDLWWTGLSDELAVDRVFERSLTSIKPVVPVAGVQVFPGYDFGYPYPYPRATLPAGFSYP
jgi:hypothetical protein